MPAGSSPVPAAEEAKTVTVSPALCLREPVPEKGPLLSLLIWVDTRLCNTAEHSPSPQGRAGTSRLAEAGGGSGRVGWGQG